MEASSVKQTGADSQKSACFLIEVKMNTFVDNEKWVYIVVQNSGQDEHIFGLHDPENDLDFIPAFFNKEDAQQGLLNMPHSSGMRYEVQTIIYEDLSEYAKQNLSMIFFLDMNGQILAKIES
jgi:hypothetical protein